MNTYKEWTRERLVNLILEAAKKRKKVDPAPVPEPTPSPAPAPVANDEEAEQRKQLRKELAASAQAAFDMHKSRQDWVRELQSQIVSLRQSKKKEAIPPEQADHDISIAQDQLTYLQGINWPLEMKDFERLEQIKNPAKWKAAQEPTEKPKYPDSHRPFATAGAHGEPPPPPMTDEGEPRSSNFSPEDFMSRGKVNKKNKQVEPDEVAIVRQAVNKPTGPLNWSDIQAGTTGGSARPTIARYPSAYPQIAHLSQPGVPSGFLPPDAFKRDPTSKSHPTHLWDLPRDEFDREVQKRFPDPSTTGTGMSPEFMAAHGIRPPEKPLRHKAFDPNTGASEEAPDQIASTGAGDARDASNLDTRQWRRLMFCSEKKEAILGKMQEIFKEGGVRIDLKDEDANGFLSWAMSQKDDKKVAYQAHGSNHDVLKYPVLDAEGNTTIYPTTYFTSETDWKKVVDLVIGKAAVPAIVVAQAKPDDGNNQPMYVVKGHHAWLAAVIIDRFNKSDATTLGRPYQPFMITLQKLIAPIKKIQNMANEYGGGFEYIRKQKDNILKYMRDLTREFPDWNNVGVYNKYMGKFLEWLQNNPRANIKVESLEVPLVDLEGNANLVPTENFGDSEADWNEAFRMAMQMRHGSVPKDKELKPIWVAQAKPVASEPMFIMDGHHRWLANVILDAIDRNWAKQTGSPYNRRKVKIYRFITPLPTLRAWAQKFVNEYPETSPDAVPEEEKPAEKGVYMIRGKSKSGKGTPVWISKRNVARWLVREGGKVVIYQIGKGGRRELGEVRYSDGSSAFEYPDPNPGQSKENLPTNAKGQVEFAMNTGKKKQSGAVVAVHPGDLVRPETKPKRDFVTTKKTFASAEPDSTWGSSDWMANQRSKDGREVVRDATLRFADPPQGEWQTVYEVRPQNVFAGQHGKWVPVDKYTSFDA